MKIDFNVVTNIIKKAARKELLPRFTLVNGESKQDGSIVTEADLSMQNCLQQELLSTFPNTVLLSEEMSVSEQENALNSDNPIWCLDPLDGTSNFAGFIPYFAVSLSLIFKQEVVMGIVYDPIRDECFFAEKNKPSTFNNQVIEYDYDNIELKKAIAIIDFKRLDKKLSTRLVQEQPFASQRNFGASALDWCWLAIHRGHVYLHGKQNIWDYSAGNFIFQNSGGHSCTLDGDAVFNCQLEPRSVVAAVNNNLLSAWYDWIKEN